MKTMKQRLFEQICDHGRRTQTEGMTDIDESQWQLVFDQQSKNYLK